MKTAPAREEALAACREGRPQLLCTRLVADLETPVSAYLKLARDLPGGFLLESVEGGAVRGRYTIIGLDPDLVWRCEDGRAEILEIDAGGRWRATAEELDPLASLGRLLAASRLDLPPGMPPMAAGLAGYMGYDMVRLMERLPAGKPDAYGVPDALFVRPRLTAIFDLVADRITLATVIRPGGAEGPEAAFEAAHARLAAALERLSRPLPADTTGPPPEPASEAATPVAHVGRERYCEMVARAREHMAAGDIFQVVLARRFSIPFHRPPFALYRALRRLNPSPFLYFLDFEEFAIVGSSPEILVRVRDGKVTVRPIAGTRRRGANAAEDAALAAELLADSKELAEHLMLLDLGRNDVGRVALPGSVEVTERNIVERYSHVMHIVSNVEGRLDSERFDALDALAAGFPAGTVSGAPKVRAMEIIDELEPEGRGPYAGAVGYFGADGSMDTCIVLRTAVVRDGRMHVHAGAGIVADSDPESECLECENKARALFAAAAAAGG